MSIGYTSPALWLQGFLERRNIPEVTGFPLFTYHCSNDEYRELIPLVSSYRPKTPISQLKHKAWAACFVLTCSEWYRRDYSEQDGWSWAPVWQKLGFELGSSDLATAITIGMDSFWKRPIRHYSERRNFLGSVFIEGGLPFQLISGTDNRFCNMLKRVLKSYHLIELSGEPAGVNGQNN